MPSVLNTGRRAAGDGRVGKYMPRWLQTDSHAHATTHTFTGSPGLSGVRAHQLPSTRTPNAALHVCHANTALEKTSSAAKHRSLASAMYLG